MVLETAGDDLGGAGALAVDEHGERECIRFGRVRRLHLAGLDGAAAHRNQRLARLEEQGAGLQSGRQQAARVLAQVEHQSLQRGAAQLLDGLAEVRPGLRVKTRNADVADAGAHEEDAFDAGRLHVLGGEDKRQRARAARPADVDAHGLLARLGEQLR